MITERLSVSPREMSVLTMLLGEPRSRREIAQSLGVSQPELTRLLKSVKSKGFVVIQRQGMSSSVSLSDLRHASLLRRILDEYSHMRLDRILSLTSFEVLSYLAATAGGTRSDIISSTGVSARALQSALKRLRELGIVRVRTRGEYELSDRFTPIGEFLREFHAYSNQRKATEFCQDATVVWQRGDEFIIRTKCERESADFRLTALSGFEEYGVSLFLDRQYYYHPVGIWRKTIDEVLLQSLLIRPRSTRENTAILMLWERNNLSRQLGRLRKLAARYGISNELEMIVAYFRDPTRNRPPGFPKISELKEKLRSQHP